MILINCSIFSEGTSSPAMMGVIFLEDKNEFWEFKKIPSRSEFQDLSDGKIKILDLIGNSLTNKLTKFKCEKLLKEEHVKEILKDYLREDKLNNLGL